MPNDETSLDFECPNCRELVDPSWKACPSCAVEFLGQDEEAMPAVEVAPAAPAAAMASEAPAPKDELADLNDEINGELDKVEAAPAVKPPAKEFGKSSGKSSPKSRGRSSGHARAKTPPAAPAEPKAFAKAGGPIGFIGLMMVVGGVLGTVVVGNWDTVVRGLPNNYIGSLQLIAVVGAIAFALVGVVVMWLGLTRVKRGAPVA